MFWIAVKHPLFEEMDWNDKNVMKWALMLLDIKKLSTPAIVSKDHVHPFKSASAALDLMKSLKLIDCKEGSPQDESLS